jgi:hypothetical protein
MKHMQLMKEVTSMKTYMTIAAVVVLTLAFGIAYADEFPIAVKDEAGTIVYLGAFPIDNAIAAKDFSGMHRSDALVETGTALYLAMKDDMVASSDARGSAAGGVVPGDENSRIWDDLLKPTGLTE